jgi:hypothetical protein
MPRTHRSITLLLALFRPIAASAEGAYLHE